MRFLRAFILVFAMAGALPAVAVQPDEILSDPNLEARARLLSKELRCMVCQNQSIDDSDAPLARDLRVLVRDRLKAGDSDADVLHYLTARYGDFVLLRPPFRWRTALLWLGPLMLLAGGLLGLLLAARRHSQTPVAGLTAAEEARIAKLQAGEPDGRSSSL
jgi:cytochrome c-type biogenesis protein CcmH